MTAAPDRHRALPAAFPLALAGEPAGGVGADRRSWSAWWSPTTGMTSLEAFGQWLGWFCGVGLLVAINVAMAATAGVAPRHAAAGSRSRWSTAALAFYVAAFVLSLARGWAVRPGSRGHRRRARSILAWLPFVSLLQMLLVAALSLALAWTLGGRGAVPVAWSKPSRRALGAIVAFGACIGLLPLQGRLLAMLDLVSLQTLQLGLPFLAVTLGVVHALAWLLAPVREGSGVWPAFVSSALVGPLLLAFAWLSQFVLGRHRRSQPWSASWPARCCWLARCWPGRLVPRGEPSPAARAEIGDDPARHSARDRLQRGRPSAARRAAAVRMAARLLRPGRRSRASAPCLRRPPARRAV